MSLIIDYAKLSGIAQRIFCAIEKEILIEQQEEVYITKEDLAWELQTSIPNIKLGLRELKKTGYIIPRNKNSSWLRIGKEYRIGRQDTTIDKS